MKVLVLAEEYSKRDKISQAFIHTRNCEYIRNGIDVNVISFSSKESYKLDGVEVFSLEEFSKIHSIEEYDIVISHAPNIRNHCRFINKNAKKIRKLIFFFHGHEVLISKEVYPKPYKFVKKEKRIKEMIRFIYDRIKLIYMTAFFKKFLDKSTYVFVSEWMYNQFKKNIKIRYNDYKDKSYIIYNSMGKEFLEKEYDKNIKKEYDFITIRNILDVFKDDSEFNKWREKYLEYDNRKEKLWNDSNKYYYAERNDDLSRILPSEYKTFPLKDRYQEIVFEPIRENELIINFEFSNDGKDEDCLIYRNSIIKMDYKFKCEGIFIEEKNVFLESDETDNNEFKDYFEKDRGDFYTLIKQPFKIRKFGNYISTAMEFYNGINDFTLQDKTKKPLEEVLDRINSVINENTKVTIKTKKGMKKACEEYLEEFYSRDNLLMKKIRRNSKIKYS